MSGGELEFRCPVCRARQDLSEVCRRCEADLTLAVRARQRLAYLLTLPPSPQTQAEIAELAPAVKFDRNSG